MMEWLSLLLPTSYTHGTVLLGVATLGIAAGQLGTLMLLRQEALLPDAMAHATLPGLVLAYLLVVATTGQGHAPALLLLCGGAISGFLGLALVRRVINRTRLLPDAAMAIILACFFALGMVLLSYAQTLPVAGQAGLKSYIFGQAAALRLTDALSMAVVAGVTLLVIGGALPRWRALIFAHEQAVLAGLKQHYWDALLMGLIGLLVVVALPAVGLILAVALLIIPAATAQLLSTKLQARLWLASLFGASAAYIGTALSAHFANWPTGATIVLVSFAVFIVALILSRWQK